MIAGASPLPLCVRVNVAARMIGIGRTKFYELISNGEVEVIKLGTATLITTASLNAMIARKLPDQREGLILKKK
jgi:excisionase family DNA binding protein